ncbi:LysR family transcriptional regulator [Humibacter antri]
MLHSRLLDYVDEVARHGSIRGAGARLHVAPSAINRQILLLEEELGEPLFERLSRGMRPTPAGEVLLAHIRQTKQQYRDAIADMNALQSLPTGSVVIATVTGLASSMVSTAAVRFHSRHPEVHLSINTMSGHDTLEAVSRGDADLGLGFNLTLSNPLETVWQRDARLGAVLAPEHPLARMAAVPLTQCADYPLVFPEHPMVIHSIVGAAFADAGIDVEPAFHTNSIETMKQIASAGGAIAFLSRYDVPDEQHDGRLVYRPIEGRAFGDNVLSLVRRERSVHDLAGRLFADEMGATLESVVPHPALP